MVLLKRIQKQFLGVLRLGGDVASVGRPARSEHDQGNGNRVGFLSRKAKDANFSGGARLHKAAGSDGVAVGRPRGIDRTEFSGNQQHGVTAVGGGKIDLWIQGTKQRQR